MKRVFVLILAIVMLINCSVVCYAADITTVNDYRKLPHKEFSPLEMNQYARGETVSNGWWVADIDLQFASSDSYTDSTKTTRWPIDEIYAYFRAYNGNELKYSRMDRQNNASHASAGYDHVLFVTECIGQHYFEEEGYQSWNVETYYDF